MNWFRLTPSRSDAFASSSCNVRGMRSSRRPLYVPDRWRCLGAVPSGGTSRTASGVAMARVYLARRPRIRVSIQILSKLRQAGREQARRMRLRDPERVRDLALAHVGEVPAAQRLALAPVQRPHAGGDRDAALGRAEGLVGGDGRAGVGECQRGLGLLDVHRFGEVALAPLCSGHELELRRRAVQVAREPAAGSANALLALLFSPRYADQTAAVAQMPLDLADDGRRSERRQVYAQGGLETIHGLDQPERADLLEIFDLLAAMCEAACESARKRQVRLDQPFARGEVAVQPVRALQPRALHTRETGRLWANALHFVFGHCRYFATHLQSMGRSAAVWVLLLVDVHFRSLDGGMRCRRRSCRGRGACCARVRCCRRRVSSRWHSRSPRMPTTSRRRRR